MGSTRVKVKIGYRDSPESASRKRMLNRTAIHHTAVGFPEIEQVLQFCLRTALGIAPTERIMFTPLILECLHMPAMLPRIAKDPIKVPPVIDRLRSAKRQNCTSR
jgi:hypothetical protein